VSLIEYEAGFTESKERIRHLNSKSNIFFLIMLIGLLLFLTAFFMNSQEPDSSLHKASGIVAFFGFIILWFGGLFFIGIRGSAFSISNICGAKYTMDEKSIQIKFRYKNRFVQWLAGDFFRFMDPLSRLFSRLYSRFIKVDYYQDFYDSVVLNRIDFKSIEHIELGEFQGRKSAYIEYYSKYPYRNKVRQHIVLPDKEPEKMFDRIRSMIKG